jgi:hypothetical protein
MVPESVSSLEREGSGLRLARAAAVAADILAQPGAPLDKETVYGGRFVYSSREDPSTILEIDFESGTVVYNSGLAEYSLDRTTPNLPADREATTDAELQLRQLGLFPESPEEVVVASVGGVATGVLSKDGSTAVFDKLKTVRFERQLDGIPVEGPGSRMIVHLGRDSKLAGLIWNWPRLQRTALARADIRTPDELRKASIERLESVSEGAASVVVQQARLVYYHDEFGVVEPAYHVEAVRTYHAVDTQSGGRSDVPVSFDAPYDFYLPVLRSSNAQIPDLSLDEGTVATDDRIPSNGGSREGDEEQLEERYPQSLRPEIVR